MKKEQILLSDWHRILLGKAPPIFLVETALRSVIVFLALVAAARLLGKRMNGQLSITELAVMITLGAIVALPMQTPDRGVLIGVFLLGCAVAFQRGLNLLSWKSQAIERLVQGRGSVLVRDGVLDLRELRRVRISREQLYASLRNEQIYNLGKIKRLYLEACGIYSIFQRTPPEAGLPLIPATDGEMSKALKRVPGQFACVGCGKTRRMEKSSCPNCRNAQSLEAVI